MRRFVVAILAGVLSAFSAAVPAQPFPSKPLKIVVPFPPGGAGDILGRVLAESMAKGLGQPVIIDNRPGGGAVIGYEFAARAPADGYTMLVMFPSFVINPAVRRVGYDPIKDFRTVGQAISMPMAIAVNSAVPARTFAELVSLARARPGELAYGTPGQGTTQHLFGEMLKLAAKIDITHAPYQGASPAFTAMLGGHIPMVVANLNEVAANAHTGKIRVLAVTTKERVEALPDVPSLREAGHPDLDTTNWAGLVVPAGTPDSVIARLNAELLRALRTPEVQEKLKAQRFIPSPGTPEEFAQLVRSESARYAKAIKEAGIRLD